VLRQKRFLVGGALVAVAIGYLGFMGFQGSATYYYKVSELFEQENLDYEQSLRVNGQVAPGSIEREQGGLTTRFAVVEGGQSLPVVYRGALPDTFKEEADVVVEGRLDPSGVFQADSIMMKCPSKYEPEEGE
jgi:cytochrome c-type biogenesis protein CcmE